MLKKKEMVVGLNSSFGLKIKRNWTKNMEGFISNCMKVQKGAPTGAQQLSEKSSVNEPLYQNGKEFTL